MHRRCGTTPIANFRNEFRADPGSASLHCMPRRARDDDARHLFTGVSATGVNAPLPENHEMMLFATSSSIARRVGVRARTDMRQQHHMIHVDQFPWHLRLVGEHVEAGGEDHPLLQGLDQRRLVHHGAARHVDQDAVRAERVEHLGIDQVAGRRAAGRDHEQHIGGARHLDEVRIVLVGNIGRPARVIDHRHFHCLEPARDRLANAAHADDPDGAVAQRGRELVVAAVLFPFARAEITLGLGQLPHGCEQQPKRRIRHLLVEHVRRIGDDDAVPAGPFGVDVVVADAEARYDLELGKARHDRAIDRPVTGDRRDGAHLRRDRSDEGLLVARRESAVQGETGLLQGVLDDRLRSEHHHVGFVAGHELSPCDERS